MLIITVYIIAQSTGSLTMISFISSHHTHIKQDKRATNCHNIQSMHTKHANTNYHASVMPTCAKSLIGCQINRQGEVINHTDNRTLTRFASILPYISCTCFYNRTPYTASRTLVFLGRGLSKRFPDRVVRRAR